MNYHNNHINNNSNPIQFNQQARVQPQPIPGTNQHQHSFDINTINPTLLHVIKQEPSEDSSFPYEDDFNSIMSPLSTSPVDINYNNAIILPRFANRN